MEPERILQDAESNSKVCDYWLMRHFEIEALSVETAGQSAVGSLVGMVGIVDGRTFRDAVLAQRDIVTSNLCNAQGITEPDSSGLPPTATDESLGDIRDILLRIEKQVSDENGS